MGKQFFLLTVGLLAGGFARSSFADLTSGQVQTLLTESGNALYPDQQPGFKKVMTEAYQLRPLVIAEATSGLSSDNLHFRLASAVFFQTLADDRRNSSSRENYVSPLEDKKLRNAVLDVILKRLPEEKEFRVRLALARSLGGLADVNRGEAILKIMVDDMKAEGGIYLSLKVENVVPHLAEALDLLHFAPAVPIFEELLKFKDRNASAGIYHLGEVGGETEIPKIAEWIKHVDFGEREEGVRAIGHIVDRTGDKEGKGFLILKDIFLDHDFANSKKVKSSVLYAMAGSENSQAQDFLVTTINRETEANTVHSAVVALLMMKPGLRTTPAITQFLQTVINDKGKGFTPTYRLRLGETIAISLAVRPILRKPGEIELMDTEILVKRLVELRDQLRTEVDKKALESFETYLDTHLKK